jgi:hypothetical protein
MKKVSARLQEHSLFPFFVMWSLIKGAQIPLCEGITESISP